MSKKEEKKHDELENVAHALTASEAFIEKYQKQLLMAVAAVVLAVLAVILFISATVVKENAKGDLREQCARHPESAACMPF